MSSTNDIEPGLDEASRDMILRVAERVGSLILGHWDGGLDQMVHDMSSRFPIRAPPSVSGRSSPVPQRSRRNSARSGRPSITVVSPEEFTLLGTSSGGPAGVRPSSPHPNYPLPSFPFATVSSNPPVVTGREFEAPLAWNVAPAPDLAPDADLAETLDTEEARELANRERERVQRAVQDITAQLEGGSHNIVELQVSSIVSHSKKISDDGIHHPALLF